jgi:hypothetical protein
MVKTMTKPVDLTAYRNKKQRAEYDEALEQSDIATDLIDPPPVHALHKSMKQRQLREWAKQIREEPSKAPPKPKGLTPKTEPYRPPNRLTDDEWYAGVCAGTIDPTPKYKSKPKPKPKSKKPKRPAPGTIKRFQQDRDANLNKVLQEIVAKEFKKGNFTREKKWKEGCGWYDVYTATPEYMATLDLT